MKKAIMMLGMVLAWVCGVFGATHEGVQLWENGPLWAKTNIGAILPTETGYYFWWGDTLGYKWQNSQWVASDGSVSGYSFSSTTSGKTIAQLQAMGAVGDDCNLLPAFDAAAQQWGDDWRVPKKSEYKNLMELCSWSWTTNNGVVGYTVTGKGLYSGNSVFFPVTGYGQGATTNGIWNIWMWSSTADGNTSYRISWSSTSRGGASNTGRSNGYPIRPVKSMSAAKAASAVALDTRTGTRVVKTTESIAYDVAWGGASSGTLKVNGTAVSGLSSKGNYSWTPNTSQTNYWKLAYTAGTANYSATFKHLANYAITYADTKGATNTNPTQYNYDSSITFAALPNVTGYVFNGWNPTKIAAGGFGAKTVTAKWTPISYAVKFNANGGSGTMANLAMTYGTAKTLTANAFTRTGYTFKGWATSSGATTAAYTDKQSVNNLTSTANGTVNLYAVWQVNTYTVKFNANGGSGTTAQLACTYGQNASLTANAFTRAGYAFVGWMTSANGTTVAYTDKQSVLNLSTQANATINLYARWTDKWYVDAEAGDDTNQGDSASLPFKTIQHAIDKSVPGMTIIVADGTYAPINSNNKSITIQSVNGAERTIIDGGNTAMCARLSGYSATASMTNTILRGFTIQNGYSTPFDGGGVYGGSLYDCLVVSNRAARSGGGTCYSALYHCTVEGNSCGNSGGGSHSAMAYDCLFINNSCPTNGAGAYGGVLVNCSVISNRAEKSGGGTYAAAVTNCVLQGNVALTHGGGAYGGSLYGCVVSNNTASVSGGGINNATAIRCVIADNKCALASTGYGGGAYNGVLENCLIYGNRATEGAGGGTSRSVCRNCTIYGNRCGYNSGGTHAWLVDGVSVSTNFNCIVYGNTAGTTDKEVDYRMASFNCYTNDPFFVDAANGDFRLLANSPCIDAGNNAYVVGEVDIAGNTRIVNGNVDVGAYEYTLSSELAEALEWDPAKFDVSVKYDGLVHTIDANALEAAFDAAMIGDSVVDYAISGTDEPPALPWSAEPPTATDAGEYLVWYRVVNPGYEQIVHSAKLTVTKRELTLTSGSDSKEYDGTALTKHTVIVGGDGFVSGEGASYSYAGSQTVAGTSANIFGYTLNAGTKADNYTITTSEGALTVTKAANAWTAEPSIAGWTYGQAASVPNIGAAKFGTAGVAYSAVPQNAGSYTATFTVPETANYDGLSKSVQFTIAKATYNMSGAKWGASSFTYDGNSHAVTLSGLPYGVSATYSGNSATAAGNYTAHANLAYDAANYNAPSIADKPWSIARKSIAGATVTLGDTLVYNGAEQAQAVAGVKVGGLNVTYAVSGNRGTDVGLYTLAVTGTGNFTGTVTAQWKIWPDGIVQQVTPYDGIYDGKGHGIAVAVSKPANATVKYAYAEQGPYAEEDILFTNVTETAVTVWYMVEAENYTTITNCGTVKVSPRTLTGAMASVQDVSFTYDGAAKKPAVTVSDGNPSIITEDDYDVAYSDNVNAGEATVTLTGKGNYTGTVTKHFDIAKAEVAAPASVASKAYTGGLLKSGLPGTARYSVTDNGGVDAGNYPVTLTLTDAVNYRWSGGDSNPLNLTFTITKATNAWIAEPFIAGWTYGQAASVPNMGVAKFGTVTVIYGAMGPSRPTEVGSYVATFLVAESENYTGLTKDVAFKISSSEAETLKDIFDDLPADITPDGDGGWKVTLTNDIDSADLPIEIPDNLGQVTIDLNGHDLIGGNGDDGDGTTPGGDGRPAIVIVPGGGGDPTRLTIITTGDDSLVKGGDGGAGNPGGNGAPAIKVEDGTNGGVKIDVGEGVTVRGGDGGASKTGRGGDGGAGIDGDVGTNDGTIEGGAGGDSVDGDGGDGGHGVDGDVDVNNGTISGGNGGHSDHGLGGDGGKGVTGDVGTNNGTIAGGKGGGTIDGTPGEDGIPVGGTIGGGSGTVVKVNVAVPEVPSAEYTGEAIAPLVPTSALYAVSASGGTRPGSYPVMLTLLDMANYEWIPRDGATVNGALAVVNFVIIDPPPHIETEGDGKSGRENAASVVATYDGAGHGISVTVTYPPTGVRIRYARSEKGPFTDEKQLFTNAVDAAETWYELSADGFEPVTNMATVTIAPRSLAMAVLGSLRFVDRGGVRTPVPTLVDDLGHEVPPSDYVFTWEEESSGAMTLSFEGRGNYLGLFSTKLAQTRFHVVFDANGGEVDSEGADYDIGTYYGVLPVPSKAGYLFDGWYEKADFAGEPVTRNTQVIAQDLTLHAKWLRRALWYTDATFHLEGAATYDGYVVDPAAGDRVAGTIQVKAGKPNKKTGLSKLTVTVQLAGGKKTKFKGSTFDGALTGNVGGLALDLRLGYSSLTGTLGGYALDGARNVFTAKDADSKVVAAQALKQWQGTYVAAWEGASGWNGLSLDVKSKGKVKVSGTLADGAKVSAKSQLLVGERECALAVSWTKKGASVACLVWFCEDGTVECMNADGAATLIANARDGATLPSGAAFRIDAATMSAVVPGLQAELLPDGVEVRMKGAKFDIDKAGKVSAKGGAVDLSKAGTNPAGLKLSYKMKNCTFKGSFSAYALSGGKLKKVKVTVSGVVLGRKGYGTASIKKVGSVPISIE